MSFVDMKLDSASTLRCSSIQCVQGRSQDRTGLHVKRPTHWLKQRRQTAEDGSIHVRVKETTPQDYLRNCLNRTD